MLSFLFGPFVPWGCIAFVCLRLCYHLTMQEANRLSTLKKWLGSKRHPLREREVEVFIIMMEL